MPEKPKFAVAPKVVHLDSDSNQSTRAGLARLPAAVHAVHEKGKFLIGSSLSRFFDQVDDSLFELADKASNNQDQNIYFDSMREIRVQRRGIERAFVRAIDEAFAALMAPAAARSTPEDSLTTNTLSLISNDDLEEMVAVDSTVSRASRELAEPIQHLSLRLDSLVPCKVYEKNNPLGPRVLCSAFTQQVKGLDVDIKVKLVLFKLFDRIVISGLAKVYESTNNLLSEHNVLPTLSGVQTSARTPNSRQASGATEARASHTATQPASQSNTEVLNVLKQLFGEKLVAEASPQEQMIAGNELMALLSLAQRAPAVQAPVNPGQAVSKVGDVRILLGEIEKQSGIRADIGRIDDEVINLVNMLFEFILQDKNLSAPMKTLISRLQIPIVKVALMDKTFFTKGGHAARRLLNEMATAALGWQGEKEGKQDPLYNKVEQIVTRLLHDFDSDVSIFSELLADFSAFMEKECRRTALMERRTLDAEDGKARAEMARMTVNLEVELRIVDRRLPKIARKLIDEAWSNVMFVLGLKHGFDSRDWQNALHTLDDLLWSVAIPETVEDRKTLIRLVPDLLKRLRAGFDTISFNPFEMSNLFKALEEVHLACIRGTVLPPEAMAPMLRTPLAEPQKAAAKTAPQAANQAPPKAPAKKAPAKEEKPEAEQKPVELEKVEKVESVQALAEDDIHIQQVQNFVQGAWFEYRIEVHEVTRCRLAAYIRPTGKYIFVNRNGMKVAEKTQQDLALALKQGHIRPLDNSMLFDRALETVVSSLRKNPKL